jgi:hypothetical protein
MVSGSVDRRSYRATHALAKERTRADTSRVRHARPTAILIAALLLGLLHAGIAQAATVSGTVRRDEASALPWAGCDGVTPNIALRYNGVKTTTTCDRTTGSFTMTPALGATERVVVIWIDGASPSKGAIYTRNNGTANITGLTLTQNRVRMRSETATNFDGTMFSTYDGSNDADIPIKDNGSSIVGTAGVELHVDAGETLDMSTTYEPDVTSLHLAAGASVIGNTWSTVELTGSGELSDCTRGPGLSIPLCLDAGATVPDDSLSVEFSPADGPIAIPPLQYQWVSISGGWTATLGTGPGQTFGFSSGLEVGIWWGGLGHLDLTQWSPTIDAESIILSESGSTIVSRSPGTMTVHDGFYGDGSVDLPEYTINVLAGDPLLYLGGTGEENTWRMGSLQLRNAFTRPDPFVNGTGMTAPWDSGAAGKDTPNDVHWWYNSSGRDTVVGRGASGAGSWMVRTQYDGATMWTRTWDPSPAGDDSANAIADIDSEWTTDLVVGGRIAQNGGDWAVRRVDATTGEFHGVAGGTGTNPTTAFGNTDLDANGTNDTYVYGHATGFDEVTSMIGVDTNQVIVVGTTWNGTSQQVRVVQLDEAGVEVAPAITYDTAGADYAPRKVCLGQNGHDGYVVGGDSTNGGDMFVRHFEYTPTTNYWDGVGAESTPFGTVDVDGNGTADTLRLGAGGSAERGGGCEAVTGWRILAFGNQTTAGNTDGIIARVEDSGLQDMTFGTGGFARFDSGTNGDDLAGIHVEPPSETRGGVIASGRFGTNGGDAALERFDADGQLDYAWGTNGAYTYDSGAGNDDAFTTSTEQWDGDEEFLVGMRDGASGGGDIRMAQFTSAGQLENGAAGKVHVEVASGNYQDAESSFTIANDVSIGNAADAADTVLDTETYDPSFEVDGDTTISSRGWMRLSSTSPTLLRGDLNNTAGGKLHAGAGTVRIRPAATTSLIAAGAPAGAPAFANSFSGLDIDLATTGSATPRLVQLPNASTTRVRSDLRLDGTSCAPRLRLAAASGTAAIDATGATRTGDYVDVSNVTVGPAWTIPNGTLSGTTTGWTVTTPCGAPLPLAPDDLYVHDTNAQVGTYHNLHVGSVTPHFSVMNRTATTVDQQRVQVWSDMVDSRTRNLFRFDNAGTDAGAAGGSITLDAGANAPTYDATGKFSQALLFDGNDRAHTTTGGYDSQTSLTLEAWVKKGAGAPAGYSDLIRIEDGTDTKVFLGIMSDGTLDSGYEDSSNYTNGINWVGSTAWDGGWHHFAATFEPQGTGVLVRQYFDGVLVGTGNWDLPMHSVSGAQAYLGNGYYMGGGDLKGSLDDVRISTRALTSDEISGYVHTGRRHGDLLWDSGNLAACAACPVANNFRTSDATYAGPSGLLLEGGRYWVTSQLRTNATGTPASTWSAWSEPDWFEARNATSITITTPTAVALGTVIPGGDVAATSSVDVSTTGGDGYTLYGRGESDTWTMTSGAYNIPRWTGAPTPTAWPAGTAGAGYFGVTVLAATGGKDTARWGTGTSATDYANLNYGGLRKTVDLALHSRATYSAATDTIQLGWRSNPPLATPPGSYSGTVTLVALANP